MSDLSDRIWWTRKAKIKAERRLLNLDYYSQFLLLWYSSFLVCYSIYSLVNPAGNNEAAIMVALSVLILVLTLFVNNMNYKGRALLIKQCYEKLSVIYTDAKNNVEQLTIDKEYQAILSASENHLERDFIKAVVDEYNNTKDERLLTKTPTLWHIVQVWFYTIRNCLTFLAFLLFPLFILYFLRGDL